MEISLKKILINFYLSDDFKPCPEGYSRNRVGQCGPLLTPLPAENNVISY